MYNYYTLLHVINNFITIFFLINEARQNSLICIYAYICIMHTYLSNYRSDDIKRYVLRVNSTTSLFTSRYIYYIIKTQIVNTVILNT